MTIRRASAFRPALLVAALLAALLVAGLPPSATAATGAAPAAGAASATGAAPQAAAAPARASAGAFRCNRNTVLTLAGLDSLSGELLLRSPEGWLVTTRPSPVDAGGGDWTETATYHREPASPRVYGFSVGAGAVFGVHGCGDGCLQAVRWQDGSWEPLGEALREAPSGIAHGTYDLSGAPWLVVQRPLPPGTGPDDGVEAHAWRLVEGTWRAAGRSMVRSSGAAAAVPAPQHPDAVLSGTVRFRVGAEPAVWLSSLPSLPPEDVGVLVPVDEGAAYLTARGKLLLSRDGESWVRTRWTPWGQHPTRLWRPGEDYGLDLPTGDRRGPLHAIWVDRRAAVGGNLYLTTWRPGSGWQPVADLHREITTLDGERLDYNEIAVTGPGTWVLLTGCVNTANGPGLVLRTAGPAGLTRPRFLPLRPGD